MLSPPIKAFVQARYAKDGALLLPPLPPLCLCAAPPVPSPPLPPLPSPVLPRTFSSVGSLVFSSLARHLLFCCLSYFLLSCLCCLSCLSCLVPSPSLCLVPSPLLRLAFFPFLSPFMSLTGALFFLFNFTTPHTYLTLHSAAQTCLQLQSSFRLFR